MIGEKCECCKDEVLIIKEMNGKKLCLDCYCTYKNTNNIPYENEIGKNNIQQFSENPLPSDVKHHSDRRCPNCGRIIPFDSIVCPYCGKRFEDFF